MKLARDVLSTLDGCDEANARAQFELNTWTGAGSAYATRFEKAVKAALPSGVTLDSMKGEYLGTLHGDPGSVWTVTLSGDKAALQALIDKPVEVDTGYGKAEPGTQMEPLTFTKWVK
jgi:hypothetical protein